MTDPKNNQAKDFTGQDVDLYDWEVAKIEQELMPPIVRRFSRLPATEKNLEEMASRIQDAFMTLGIVAHVNTAYAYMGTGQPEVLLVTRIPDHDDSKYGHDHERKKTEVVEAKELGEDYRGQKFKHKK